MLETSARLLALLSLLQARRDWPGGLLAERLEVSARTVRRDVDRLRELGYPVTATKGPDGGYRLAAGAELPPLLFDDEQAVAVAVALQTATTSVLGIEEGALRALATVRQVMPARLRHRIDALQVTPVARAGGSRPRVDAEQLLAIGTAVRAREVLRFDYSGGSRSRSRGGEGGGGGEGVGDVAPPRRVEPHHLVTWGERWYLVAWDLDRVDWRTFRVDRLAVRTPTGPRFVPRPLPAPDLATYIAESFARPSSPCQGEAIMHVGAAQIAPWVGSAVLEELGPERCRLIAGSWSWAGLASWLGMFDVEFDVVGPAELHTAAAMLTRRYAAATAGPGSAVNRTG